MGKYIRQWFVWWHGEGAAHQGDVYRCETCGRLITWNAIRDDKACCQRRVYQVNPTLFEKFRLLVLPWWDK